MLCCLVVITQEREISQSQLWRLSLSWGQDLSCPIPELGHGLSDEFSGVGGVRVILSECVELIGDRTE